jgi:energy-coupling factor transporter ATP-binding protein EcfA2
MGRMGAGPPGGLLVCGQPGSGKEELVRVLDRVLSTDLYCLTHVVHIHGRDYDPERPAKTQQRLIPLVRPLF